MRLNSLLMLATVAILGCQREIPPEAPPRPALVVTVGEQTEATPAILVGEVRSRYESAQGFRIPGKIVQRYVEVGALVEQGQLLARLDNQDRSLSTEAARAQTASAQADWVLTQAELQRQQALYEKHFISKQALDVQIAKEKAAAAQVRQLRAQAAVTGNQTQYTDLPADRAGVVTWIRAEPGQVVDAGETIVRIAVPETLEVDIAVPESRMQGIVPGRTALVKLWAQPANIYQALVREVAPAADSATRTFAVRVAFQDADQNVRLGMTAGVRFADEFDQLWLLPSPAVTQRDGRAVVWVVDGNNQVQPRPVTVGSYREDGVTLTQGLKKGEKVVAVGVHSLLPGQTVTPQALQGSR